MNKRQLFLLNTFYVISTMQDRLYEIAIRSKIYLVHTLHQSCKIVLALLSRLKKLQFEEGKR